MVDLTRKESVSKHIFSWAYARPGLVPLAFCAANLARPAKLRAPNALMALLVAASVQLAFDLGLEGCAWGVVAPPALAAGVCIPLFLLVTHCASAGYLRYS